MDAFDVLGIEATSDEIAIRRAYATQLKRVSGDADRDAFMQLRQAYEDAVETARMERWEEDGDEDAPAAQAELHADIAKDAGAIIEPLASEGEDDDPGAEAAVQRDDSQFDAEAACEPPFAPPGSVEMSEFRDRFQAAIDGGDSDSAARLLRGALARGLLRVGQESASMRKVVEVALLDPRATIEQLVALTSTFGGEPGMHAPGILKDNMQQLHDRISAMRWLAQLESDSRKGGVWPGTFVVRRFRRASRVAAAILRHSMLGIGAADLDTLRAEASKIARYSPWLNGCVNPERFAKQLARIERRLEPSGWRLLLIGTLLLMCGVVAHQPRYQMASLGLLDLALLLVGNWFFTLVGVALLGLIAWALVFLMG